VVVLTLLDMDRFWIDSNRDPGAMVIFKVTGDRTCVCCPSRADFASEIFCGRCFGV
jgi:hypothetical protein